MLTFQELGGSPTEKYTSDGFSATRVFLVPWEERNEFAQAVFGDNSESASARRLGYPGRKDVFAYTLRFEPFDHDAINVAELADLKNDFAHYNGSFARATVDYHTVDSSDRSDGPINEEGTSITYRMVVESEEVAIDAAGWQWSDTGEPMDCAPDDDCSQTRRLKKIVPITIHYVTWSQVVNPPWEAIAAQQGTVNNAPFLGCSAGTLLFQGGEANKLYRPGSGLEEGPSSFVWGIKYSFREKSVKMNGTVGGWNHFYRPETGTWVVVKNGTSSLYDSSDFNALFRSVLPDDVP